MKKRPGDARFFLFGPSHSNLFSRSYFRPHQTLHCGTIGRSYSNFILLSRIIEKISREDYFGYVAKNIFAPAGVANAGSLPEDESVPKAPRMKMEIYR